MSNKIITLSFDDGEIYDKRVISLLDKYSLKATFNLCSATLGNSGYLVKSQRNYCKVAESDLGMYRGHEIATHGAHHIGFVELSPDEIRAELLDDISVFSKYASEPIITTAYPGGHYDSATIDTLRKLGIVRFARAIPDGTLDFTTFTEPYAIVPQRHFFDRDVFEVIDLFERLDTDTTAVLHLFCHSFEIEMRDGGWQLFESILARLSKIDCDKLTNGQAYTIAFNKGV